MREGKPIAFRLRKKQFAKPGQQNRATGESPTLFLLRSKDETGARPNKTLSLN